MRHDIDFAPLVTHAPGDSVYGALGIASRATDVEAVDDGLAGFGARTPHAPRHQHDLARAAAEILAQSFIHHLRRYHAQVILHGQPSAEDLVFAPEPRGIGGFEEMNHAGGVPAQSVISGAREPIE